MMKISIRSKTLIAFIGLIIAMLIGQFVFIHFFAKDYYIHIKSQVIEQGYEDFVKAYDGTIESIEETTEMYEMRHGINYIITKNQEVFYSSRDDKTNRNFGYIIGGPDGKHQKIEDALSEGKGQPMALQLEKEFQYGQDTYVCMLMLPMTSIESSVAVLSQSNMWIAGIAVCIGLVLAFFISKSITKPIREVEYVAERLADLDFSTKAKESSSSLEIANLAKSINTMSDNLKQTILELNETNGKLEDELEYHKQLEKTQRDFIGNVSHEMKTPLALLQLYATNLKSQIEGIDQEYYYDTMIEETNRLSEMVSSMLTISSVESGLYTMKMEQLSFSTLCNRMVMKMAPMLDEFQMSIQIQNDLEITGDAQYLEQAMKNYLSNAIQHTAQGGQIRIDAFKENEEIVFRVWNEGTRIETSELEEIWKSFYRSDQARVRTNQNVGLGLYIVRTIIQKHNGSYQAYNHENGVCFEFRISS